MDAEGGEGEIWEGGGKRYKMEKVRVRPPSMQGGGICLSHPRGASFFVLKREDFVSDRMELPACETPHSSRFRVRSICYARL